MRDVAGEFDVDEVTAVVAARLRERHPEVPEKEVEKTARLEVEALAGRPVQDYVAVLSERAAHKKLKKR